MTKLRQDYNGNALWNWRVAIAGGQGFFHVSSVKINIGLTAELAQRGHDVVGECPGPLVFTQAALAEEFAGVNGRPNPNADLRGTKHPGANGVGIAAADHGNGNDWHISSDSHASCPGFSAINPAIGRACTLGINAEKFPSVQDVPGRGEQHLTGFGGRTVERNLTNRGVEPFLQPADDTRGGKIFAFAGGTAAAGKRNP